MEPKTAFEFFLQDHIRRGRRDAIITHLVQTAKDAGAHPVRMNCTHASYCDKALDLAKRKPGVMLWVTGYEAYKVSRRIDTPPAGFFPTVAFILNFPGFRTVSHAIDGTETPEEIIKMTEETKR